MSAWASDDLASVIIRPDVEFAGWGQGVIEAWNPDTFENVIQYRGSQHENLPVASGVEALTYQPGDVVMLSRWQPTGGGATTLRIGAGGRVIVPGTGAAEKAVQFMQSALAQRLSIEVIRARFHQQVGENVRTASSSFDDPDSGDPRPVISDVEIVTGVAVVWLSGQFANLNYPVSPNGVGEMVMGVEVSGATSKSPSHAQATSIGRSFGGGDARPSGRIGSTVIFDDLNPGLHTFTAKYMVTSTLIEGAVFAPRMVVLGM